MSMTDAVRLIVPLGVCGVACVTDLRSRRVPNWLTMGAVVASLGFGAAVGGSALVWQSLAGTALGLAIFFPFFALGGLGGGDVKLLGAVGAWLGPAGVVWAALYAMISGGVLAVALAVLRRRTVATLRNVRFMLTHWRVVGLSPVEGLTLGDSRSPKLAYAVPVAVGTVVSLWLH